MLWAIYNVLFFVGFTLLLPHFFWRMRRRGGYARNFLQRIARYSPEAQKRLGEVSRVWIHAVSVGEILVAERLIRELRAAMPDLRFLVSTTTSTGYALADRRLDPQDALIYVPADLPCIIRRALNRIRPRALILVENELWPNLIRQCRRRGIPVCMVNARISERSFRGYRRVRLFTRALLPQLQAFCAQSEVDARRLVALGAPPDRVRVLGSAKYDLETGGDGAEERARSVFRAAAASPQAPVLLGGSTWPGEEEALLDAYRELRVKWPDLWLVLVPRHAERAGDIEREILARGLSLVRRSELRPDAPPFSLRPDVLLVDTTGELRDFYAGATVIFVGKSLTRHGGQNLIEPAVFGRAILVGPFMENFAAILNDFRTAEAVVQVADAAGLQQALGELLSDPARREALGRRAAEVVRNKAGAVRVTVDILRPFLTDEPSAL